MSTDAGVAAVENWMRGVDAVRDHLCSLTVGIAAVVGADLSQIPHSYLRAMMPMMGSLSRAALAALDPRLMILVRPAACIA